MPHPHFDLGTDQLATSAQMGTSSPQSSSASPPQQRPQAQSDDPQTETFVPAQFVGPGTRSSLHDWVVAISLPGASR